MRETIPNDPYIFKVNIFDQDFFHFTFYDAILNK